MTCNKKSPRSLTARGIDYLSRREYSRLELYRKLVRNLLEGETPDDVNEVLDGLTEKGYLSDERYAQARIRTRSARYGNQRLRQELSMAGVDLETIGYALEETAPELERARVVYARKFTHAPTDEKDRAKQIRYLTSRGFSFDVVSKIIREANTDTE